MDNIDVAAERAYSTPLSNSPLLPLLLLSLTTQKHAPNTAKTVQTEYDYIIVGAGTAGFIVASRLSELPCVSVLLLEAGKPPPLLTDVPALQRAFWFTDIDWSYRTVPQRYTGRGLVNRQVPWSSGKTLGGSSILNGMLYVRGNRDNFDKWAAEGAKGWSYEEVLPYFKKLEDNRDPEYVANGYHGVGGPQTVHRPRYSYEIKDTLFQTIKAMGYEVIDSNGPRQTGFYDQQGHLRSGQRCSTAKAYLVPAENRTNLDILPNARVLKVLIKNRRAVGVEFDFQNRTFHVRARREVIMSAGTVNTAQLLMLSGIGPRKELERYRIPVIADLPVGKNFHDHAGAQVNFLINPAIPIPTVKFANPANIAQYIQNRTGPFSSTIFCSLMAFLKSNEIVPKEDNPDYQLYFFESQVEVALSLGLSPEYYSQVYATYTGRPFFTCSVSLLHAKSRGSVTLQSEDPYDPPLIDPNYLEDPRDVRDMVDGMKNCMRIGTHPIMRKVGSTPFQTLVPGCEKYVGDEDRYFECSLRSVVSAYYQQVGTARMGHPKDPRSVVDPKLRVLSIKGLRVVDASIMPYIPYGNSNTAVEMVAEKASDIIKSTIECFNNNHDEWSEHEETEWAEGTL